MAEKYFNFPIHFLEGFIENPRKSLDNIAEYAVYERSLNGPHEGSALERFKSAANFFNIKFGNVKFAMDRGEELYDSADIKSPPVGINTNIYWDYYKNHKTHFEKACLLGYLALKSIIREKAYFKLTNEYWLARMDGKACSCEFKDLSCGIRQYANEYQTKKIKSHLVDSWGLVTYSRYTRGFYVSFKLSLEDLIFEAEKARKSTKEKQQKQAVDEALEKVRERLLK